MLKWFRQSPPPHQTAVAMIGAKAGDRLVIAGVPDPPLAAELARVTGLNGQTLAINQTASAQAAIESAAANAGTLVDFADGPAPRIPCDDGHADVVVLPVADASDTATLADTLTEAFRALRAGGRLIVIEGARQGGLFARSPSPDPPGHADNVVRTLLATGGRAARCLATAEGVTYYEARR